MGKDSHKEMEKSMLSAEARQKFAELAALLAEERYGPKGPPVDTTFAEDVARSAGRVGVGDVESDTEDRIGP